nr:putative ribonuclease H-like domain-containing protein [Tanacetum cinerariifolium]
MAIPSNQYLEQQQMQMNTYVVVWRNKADLDTISIDDLYHNFKIVEQEVKRTVTLSSSLGSQNMAFPLSFGSINEVDTANIQVSTVSTPVSTVSSYDNTANLSDANVYAFRANQPNGSQLVYEDLEQIHEDDLEEIDLKWQLALLSMRARRTRKVEENLHITFLENKPMIAGGGPEWLFDIDALSKSMNYAPVPAGTHSNDFAGKGASFDADSDGHNKDKHGPSQASKSDNQKRPNAESSTKTINTIRPVNTATPTYVDYPSDHLKPDLEDTRIFDDAYDDRDKGAESDYNNLEIVISVSLIPSNRIHKDHPKEQIIGEVNTAVQTRKMAKQNEAGSYARRASPVQATKCLDIGGFTSWKKAIGTKWVYRNKRDQQGILVKNKAKLVAQGHRQEEGIDYDEFFAHVAQIEAIRLFLAYASFMDFPVYQIDVKSAFLYGSIEEKAYVSQPSGFVDPEIPDRVVKTASTPMETHKPLSNDASGTDVDVHLYRYLKGQPTLGLWYPKDSPLELIAYSDSDYAGASLYKKSTTEGCQFLGSRLISCQCKK